MTLRACGTCRFYEPSGSGARDGAETRGSMDRKRATRLMLGRWIAKRGAATEPLGTRGQQASDSAPQLLSDSSSPEARRSRLVRAQGPLEVR